VCVWKSIVITVNKTFKISYSQVSFKSIALYEWRRDGLLILISCEYIVKNPSKSPFALEGSNNGVYEVYRCQRAEATWKPLYCYKSVLIIIPPFSSGMILVITFLTALYTSKTRVAGSLIRYIVCTKKEKDSLPRHVPFERPHLPVLLITRIIRNMVLYRRSYCVQSYTCMRLNCI